MLHPSYQGKGIMKEALTEVISYGFNVMKLHSIAAQVSPKNEPSVRLLEASGFKREGYFKEDFYFRGRFMDTAIYSLLAPLS
jgi:ribosomal-protein-alanine N-acetyltransferase